MTRFRLVNPMTRLIRLLLLGDELRQSYRPDLRVPARRPSMTASGDDGANGGVAPGGSGTKPDANVRIGASAAPARHTALVAPAPASLPAVVQGQSVAAEVAVPRRCGQVRRHRAKQSG